MNRALIRRLTVADAVAFRAVRLRALQEEATAFTNSAEEFGAQPIERVRERLRGDGPDNFVLGAFLDGQLTGIVGFYRELALKRQHTGSIVMMYVTPEARGLGLGRALLQAAIDRARAIPGLEKLLLGVMTTQTAARQLYESLGFVRYGHEVRAVKVDGVYLDEDFMVLDLRGEKR